MHVRRPEGTTGKDKLNTHVDVRTCSTTQYHTMHTKYIHWMWQCGIKVDKPLAKDQRSLNSIDQFSTSEVLLYYISQLQSANNTRVILNVSSVCVWQLKSVGDRSSQAVRARASWGAFCFTSACLFCFCCWFLFCFGILLQGGELEGRGGVVVAEIGEGGGNGVAKEYHIYNNERPVLGAVGLQKKKKKHRLAVDH